MQLVGDKLVFPVVDTSNLLQAIPHARSLMHNGQLLAAVPHGLDETLVLRNLGYEPPAPLERTYTWPGRYTPMPHQIATASFLSLRRRAMVLSSMGTGKTISSLWAADYLLRSKHATRVLVVAKLSTVRPVWAREMAASFPYRTLHVLVGDKAKQHRVLGNVQDGDWAVINHDGFTGLTQHLRKFDLIIYDEATAVKTTGSIRFRRLFRFVEENKPWLWLLTGTPITQTPMDAWAYGRLLASPALPRSKATFEDLVMNKVSKFKSVPRPNAIAECQKVLQPSIRFSLDECVALPPQVMVYRESTLSKTQAAVFAEMKATAAIAAHQITAANAAVVVTKLLQVCCGCVYTSGGVVRTAVIDAEQRLTTLMDVLDEAGGKVVVFVPFRAVLDWLETALTQRGYSVASVHGDVPETERSRRFHAFQHDEHPHFLLAHPTVASHGHTLTRAQTAVWYVPTHSLETYEQANARIQRIGTTARTQVVHLLATSFERGLYTRLQNKQSVLNDFLDLVKGVNE
jgi:SNF2 family DNA or RNA helicase